jgi:hypothetical protein
MRRRAECAAPCSGAKEEEVGRQTALREKETHESCRTLHPPGRSVIPASAKSVVDSIVRTGKCRL